MLVLDVLGDVRDSAAVLSAQAESLDKAEREENERCGEADRLVGRDEADEGRRQAHAGQSDDERVLATDLVTEPAEEERPERADEEPDREDRHGAEESRHGVTLLEELRRQDGGQTPEDVEVVPF